MASRYQFSEEEIAAIRAEQNKTQNSGAKKRLKALELRAMGLSAREVSQQTGYHISYVTDLVAKYRKGGLESLSGHHYGRNRRHLSAQQEREIIEPFLERMQNGERISVRQVEKAYLEAVGYPVSSSQIYAVLRRHGWKSIKSPKRNE